MKRMIALLAVLTTMVACNQMNETSKDLLMMTQASEKVIGQFQSSLKGELMAAMKEGGAVRAIKVCRASATEVASSHSTDLIKIRRVSIQNRNVDNAATAEEAEVLARFASEPGMTSFTISDFSEANPVYLYYKPIKTGKFCLKCHGPVETLDEDVKTVLANAYPDDNATGHAVGDLRGMFVVDIQWPEAREAVTSLLADSM